MGRGDGVYGFGWFGWRFRVFCGLFPVPFGGVLGVFRGGGQSQAVRVAQRRRLKASATMAICAVALAKPT